MWAKLKVLVQYIFWDLFYSKRAKTQILVHNDDAQKADVPGKSLFQFLSWGEML